MLRAALIGLTVGVAWGLAARLFMRLVSTDPEFSWSGTLFILGLAGALGAGVGLAAEARAQRRRRWWWLALVPGLLLFAGQGMPFLPAFVVGGALLRRPSIASRAFAGLSIVGPGVMLWWAERLNDETMLAAPTRAQVSMLVVFPLLAVGLALMGDRLWGPPRATVQSPDSPERARSSRRRDSSREAPAGPA